MLRKVFSEVVSVSEKHGRKKDHHGGNTMTRGSRRRKWQPTPVFLPKKSHGCRSLVGYSPWGHKELDTTELLSMHTCMGFLVYLLLHLIKAIWSHLLTIWRKEVENDQKTLLWAPRANVYPYSS